MRAVLLLLVALFAAGCSRQSPTSPSAPAPAVAGPLRLGLSGQSNAGFIKPFLAERAIVNGYALVTTIAPCWSDVPTHDNDYDGVCWKNLKPHLTPDLDAFVWWQGESDSDNPRYRESLDDLVRRVRAQTGNPRLLIVLVQYGPVYRNEDGDGSYTQSRAWAAQDAHAIYITTDPSEFQADRAHMTDAGYRAVSERIVAAVRQR